MITREAFIQDREKVFDKVYGALSGLAIGDSFGDASRKAENRAAYQVTTDFNKGASWSTDDTEFALLTAKTLIRCRGKLTTEECVKSWMEDVCVQDEYKRGGASEIEAANNLRKGLLPPLTGKFNVFHMSDGSSMRIGPVGIVCAGDPERAMELARIESEVSHYRDGVWGAQAVAAAVAVAMVDGSFEEIMDAAWAAIPEDSWLYHNLKGAFEILDRKGSLLEAWMEIHDYLWTTQWATTAEAIPSAFVCLKACHEDFRKGRGHHRRGSRCDPGCQIRCLPDARSLDREDPLSQRHLPEFHQGHRHPGLRGEDHGHHSGRVIFRFCPSPAGEGLFTTR